MVFEDLDEPCGLLAIKTLSSWEKKTRKFAYQKECQLFDGIKLLLLMNPLTLRIS